MIFGQTACPATHSQAVLFVLRRKLSIKLAAIPHASAIDLPSQPV